MDASMHTLGMGLNAAYTAFKINGHMLGMTNVTGAKHERVNLADVAYQTQQTAGAPTGPETVLPTPLQYGQGVKVTSTTTDFSQGQLVDTGNMMDIAITGKGWFQIMKDGEIHYTRDGSFKKSADGQIVTADGYPLEPAIVIPEGGSEMTIRENGSVTVKVPGQDEPVDLERIQLAVFNNEEGLVKVGSNLRGIGPTTGEARVLNPGEEGAGNIQQGSLEGSNVKIVPLLIDTVMLTRNTQMMSQGISRADQMWGYVNSIGG